MFDTNVLTDQWNKANDKKKMTDQKKTDTKNICKLIFMELSPKELESIIYKAIVIYEENREKPDMISSNEAAKLIGRARLEKLIAMGLITRISSGNGVKATKRISRSRLLSLNNITL